MKPRSQVITLIILTTVIALSVSKTLVHILTESWWFDAVGLAQVFWTRLTWQILVWVVTFCLYALFLWQTYRIAMGQTRAEAAGIIVRHRLAHWFEDEELAARVQKFSNYLAAVAIGLIALIAASASVPAWEIVLKYLNPTDFNSRDPIFQQEIGFYVFRLPLYEGIRNWLLLLLLLALCVAVIVYGLKGKIGWQRHGKIVLSGRAKTHISLLLAAIACLVAFGFWLARYHLLYSAGGVVFGAGYTDINVRIFAYSLMSIVTAIVAALFVLTAWRRSYTLPICGIGLSLAAFVLLNGIYPWLVQSFLVEPNELVKEKPYIDYNIKFTQQAYHLHDVQRQNYDVAEAQLDNRVLQENQPTIRNIRLWDYRPLLSTYRQLQEIRLYYKFKDGDIDRYTLNGDYQQVMLSARELSYAQLPQAAQTWVNQRLKYTHGYGLVMSPVNQITSDGLPELYIKDIPPVSQVNLQVSQPAIYYGEETNNYIFTGTSTPEFDYPLGAENALTQYKGRGGVPMPSIWHRLAYAYDLGSIQILISNYFTNSSRIHYYRQIQERVNHVAPFLRLDRDPYIAIINGKLQWIVDAYTVSDRYPYSQPVAQTDNAAKTLLSESSKPIFNGGLNYIRNSVKVLVDAYDGTMQFFVIDAADPVLRTYRQIFPQLFEPNAAIPAEVKAHFRYPLDLFQIQAQMYLTYHMSEPEVFYNREDLWQFPMQIYEGNEQMVQPYYVIMRLPGETNAEFILILPFTPSNKDNAIAWMAARSNGNDYGKLLLYEFPKQKLVFGPRQIEARIDQEPQISQQFTLWSQAGSRVIRGDLLVIPIEQSLLYVEPVYLRAERGELPQLERVIVADHKEVVMAETLEKSLAAIFGDGRVDEGVPSPTGQTSSLAKSALETYQQAKAALTQGNWAEYGRYQQQLEDILRRLNQGSKP